MKLSDDGYAAVVVRLPLAITLPPPTTTSGRSFAFAYRQADVETPMIDSPRRWRYPEVPPLETVAALANWLRLSVGELQWFCDRFDNGSRRGTVHRHYIAQRKSSGKPRLIEAPKPRLKRLQRLVLDGILAAVPPSPAAHAYIAGRSCIGHARRHVGSDWLLVLDLSNWFASIGRARVHAQFRWLGYPEHVADALGRLCTTTAPNDALDGLDADARRLYRTPHLPQGSPTSPALANLVAARFDRRVLGYARFDHLRYSRYADDLAISPQPGATAPPPDRVLDALSRIALSEGFTVNASKTRVRRQQNAMVVCGSVVNERLNASRAEYDALRAAVHRFTIGRSNIDEAALRGRIAWLAQRNPKRAAGLLTKLSTACRPSDHR